LTLCVSITTSDGLVMGADSMTVVKDANLQKTYSHSTKVFELEGLPIVVMTYGLGAFGRRSIGSLIDQWLVDRPVFEKEGYTVEQVAQTLGSFVFEQHRSYLQIVRGQIEKEQVEALTSQSTDAGLETSRQRAPQFDPKQWITGLVIGGYQPGSSFPWLYTWEEPTPDGRPLKPICQRQHEGPNGEDGPPSGIDYWGDTRALHRLQVGCEQSLLAELQSLKRNRTAERTLDVIKKSEWQIVFEGMPLQDAADLVEFMLQVGCGFERFREGSPQIGGELDIAVVSQFGIHWFKRKALSKAQATLKSALGNKAREQSGSRAKTSA